MTITTYDTADGVARAAARRVLRRLLTQPTLVLGLPTGGTPIPLYRALVAAHERGHADFSRATTFNLDEFVGLGRGDEGSYRTFMHTHLFDHVNLPGNRAHVLDGRAADWRSEAERYDRCLERAGGLDLVILGIGRNGHLGFNEPDAELSARTHRVRLTPETRRANAALFNGKWQDVPTYALSMGIAAILSAREVLLLATGSAKAAIVARALTGPVTTQVPASLIQLHPHAAILLDQPAAGQLVRRGARAASGRRA